MATNEKLVNKVVYGGTTLLDLTKDSITPDKLLDGYTAHDKSGASITGTCTYDADTQDATATENTILDGYSGYVRGVKVNGKIPNKEGYEGKITTKEGKVSIPYGLHDGSGSVQIDPNAVALLTAGNIKENVTILGVTGTLTGKEGEKQQPEVTITPSSKEQVVAPNYPNSTGDFTCLSSVKVLPIPYTEEENTAGGMTVKIG